jgi:hypothetical protein
MPGWFSTLGSLWQPAVIPVSERGPEMGTSAAIVRACMGSVLIDKWESPASWWQGELCGVSEDGRCQIDMRLARLICVLTHHASFLLLRRVIPFFFSIVCISMKG